MVAAGTVGAGSLPIDGGGGGDWGGGELVLGLCFFIPFVLHGHSIGGSARFKKGGRTWGSWR